MLVTFSCILWSSRTSWIDQEEMATRSLPQEQETQLFILVAADLFCQYFSQSSFEVPTHSTIITGMLLVPSRYTEYQYLMATAWAALSPILVQTTTTEPLLRLWVCGRIWKFTLKPPLWDMTQMLHQPTRTLIRPRSVNIKWRH